MSQPTIINKFGSIQGWNNLTVRTLNRDLEGISELSYTDEQEMDNEYGAGPYPLGQSKGNYKASVSVSLYKEELDALQQSLPPGKRIQDIPAFEIVVLYEVNGNTVKDILRNCHFKNNGREVKQGEGKIIHKIDVLCSHIDWNVQ